jgi:5'-nucleotidase
MSSRRNFLKQGSMAAASFLVAHPVLYAREAIPRSRKLTVLHTNDVHSRLDPFPAEAGANAGKGGVAARALRIAEVRAKEEQVLLLDSGDIFQGTPYFNMFKGEPEIKAMQMMGYEAATMGNHDFDAGLENFAHQVASHARFPIVICNYDFTGTPMESLYKPYVILRKGDLKIGVTGLGIEMDGLVADQLTGGTKYLDPVVNLNRVAEELKVKKNCDMVICLSHLGDVYQDNKISDERLAKQSEHVDLILGGHTHRFFEKPRVYANVSGRSVIVNQAGWAGIVVGRLDFDLEAGDREKLPSGSTIVVEKKQGE